MMSKEMRAARECLLEHDKTQKKKAPDGCFTPSELDSEEFLFSNCRVRTLSKATESHCGGLG
jgi:hypothetical protein